MPILEARLLGPPRFTIEGRPAEVPSAKARALLCYLVATRQVHSRDRLAGFLWPDVPDRKAQASLRTALYDVRRGLGEHAGEFVFVERTRVAVCTEAEISLDVAALEAAGPQKGTSDLATLIAAAEAYRGEFLEGVSLPDAYDFDDWVFLERERLAHLYLNALCQLGQHYSEAGDFGRAIEAARRVLAADPLREDVHRSLMRFYAHSGQRAAALAHYRNCVEILERELKIEPLSATTELYQRIIAGEPLEAEPGGPAPINRAAAARVVVPQVDPLAALDRRTALVGRSEPLELLSTAWECAVRAVGGFVLVRGEAGIGKTRLIGALLQRVGPDATVLFGRCYEATTSQPYAPVVAALRRSLPDLDLETLELPQVWLREIARLLPEIEAFAPGGTNAPLDGVRERDRLFEAVRALLSALAAQRPSLLILEDVHWADETSLSLLEYIARHVKVHRLLLVVTYRAEEVSPERRALLRTLMAHGRAIELPSLSAAQTAELVGVLSASDDVPKHFGRRLHRATGGNPFFLVETLRALFDQGTLQAGERGWTTIAESGELDYAAIPIPESVGLIVDARLDRLNDDARTLLDCAAVLRRDFAFEVVQTASGVPAAAALDGLDELSRHGLIREVAAGSDREDVRYDFAHALVRDRVYQSLTGARRQYLHRQVAGLLESAVPTVPERIAYHYTRGGVRDRACAWSLRAGAAALAVYAGENALVHYRAARELAVSAVEEYAALAGMGDAHLGLGQPRPAIDCFDAALPLAPGGEDRAELHRRIGRAHEREGAYDHALEAFGRAQRMLRGQAMSMTALRVADGLATVYVRLGRPAEAAGLCLDALAWLAANPGVEGARRAEAWIRNTLGMAHLHDGEFPPAVENLQRSLDLKRELGDRLGEATLLNNLGVVHYHAGDDEQARTYYAGSLEIKEEIGDGYGRAIALANLALIETHLGQFDAAADCLEAAEDSAGTVGARWLMPEIRRIAAQRALALGDSEAALASAEAALDAAEELGVPAFIGVAHRVLGVVKGSGFDDPRAAKEHFRTSLAVFEMLDNEHERAKTHAAYAEVLTAVGSPEEAQAHLQAAMEVFERSGAHGRLSRLEPLLGE